MGREKIIMLPVPPELDGFFVGNVVIDGKGDGKGRVPEPAIRQSSSIQQR